MSNDNSWNINYLEKKFRKQFYNDVEDKFDFILQNSPVLIYTGQLFSNRLQLDYANQRLLEFTGVSAEKMLAKSNNLLDHIAEEDHHKLLSKLKSLGRKKTVKVEYKLKNKAGKERKVIDHLKLVKRKNGSEEILGCAIDVSEKIEKARQLKLFSLVAAKTSNGIVITDKNGKVEWVNDGFTRISGYELQDMLGKKPGDVLQGPDTAPDTIARMHANMKARSSFTEEILNYSKEDIPYWLEMRVEPIFNEKKEVESFISIQNDITQRKLYEQKLINARNKAEEASRAKSEFLSVMSHEIRTPMNSVLGMANLLMDEIDNPEHCDKLKTLNYSANHLLRLIDDILDLNKADSGKIELEKRPFSLEHVVKGAISSISPNINGNEVILDFDIEEGLPTYLEGDAHRLSQILLNLLSNAAKFTKEGYIQLFVKKIQKEDNDIRLQFQVADSGCGIPKDKQEAIFESFQQASTATTREYGGTGLGLTIVKKLLHLMGSDIQVSSNEGKGSVFFFELDLPISEKQSGGKTNSASENGDLLENKRILLVEDNKINQKVALRFLSKWKTKAEVANNGKEALEKLKVHTYDCILMDLQMPVMDGFEATAKIRKSKKKGVASIPVIALSASGIPEIRKKVHGLGINSIMSKPFKPDQLKKLLVEVLGS